MEHRDRSPVATFVCDVPESPVAAMALDDAAAHHARVKRLELGDVIRVANGAGRTGIGAIVRVDRRAVEISVEQIDLVPAPAAIHLRVPIGDRDRMLWLAEKATELGVTSWQSVHCRRSSSVSPRGEGAAFLEKLEARMVSALEQSGGAWLPRVLPEVSLDRIEVGAGELPILLDVGGDPLASVISKSPGVTPVLLFGPEGGLDASERELLHGRAWRPARLAATTLRFETAGIAAVAVCRNLYLLEER